MDEYKKINTPYELLTFMDNIRYGLYGNDDKAYINDGSTKSNEAFQKACLTKYSLAKKDKILNHMIGQCFD